MRRTVENLQRMGIALAVLSCLPACSAEPSSSLSSAAMEDVGLPAELSSKLLDRAEERWASHVAHSIRSALDGDTDAGALLRSGFAELTGGPTLGTGADQFCDGGECCPDDIPAANVLYGTDGTDLIVNFEPGRCILALGGDDVILDLARGAGAILAGDDNDLVITRSAAVVLAGSGDDTVVAKRGASGIRIEAGDGDDKVITTHRVKNAEVLGNSGDDSIYAFGKETTAIGGPGKDRVKLFGRESTAVIYDLCEVQTGERYLAPGHESSLLTPVTLEELRARGVVASSFERVEVVPAAPCRSDCGPRGVTADGSVGVLHLVKADRTTSELMSRAEAFAQVLAPSVQVSESPGQAWATRALKSPGAGSLATDVFAEQSELEAHYEPHSDTLTIQDRSFGLAQPEDLGPTADTAPDQGIGGAAATAAANSLLAGLVAQSGPLAGEHFVLDSGRAIMQAAQAAEGAPTVSWVQQFIAIYRREECGIPITSSFLEIGIHRSGAPIRISISDIQVAPAGSAVAAIGEEAAPSTFASLVEEPIAGFPEVEPLVSRDRFVYELDPGVRSMDVLPRYVGKVTYKQGPIVTRSTIEAMSITTMDPQLERLGPWAGPSLPPTPVPNGTSCSTDSDCKSGHCFRLDGLGGICGECTSDADCPGTGCTPPVPIPGRIEASACGDGSRGSGCETSSACQAGLLCGPIGTTARKTTLQTCGECITSKDCAASELCTLTFDYDAFLAVRECLPPGSVPVGSLCDSDLTCASGRCVAGDFPDGTTVRICSECNGASDCPIGHSCVPPGFGFRVGFVGGFCEGAPPP